MRHTDSLTFCSLVRCALTHKLGVRVVSVLWDSEGSATRSLGAKSALRRSLVDGRTADARFVAGRLPPLTV